MRNNFFLLLLLIFFFSCKNKTRKVTFFIENGSRVDTSINIKVSINDVIKIDNIFNYSAIVTPNYDAFIFEELIQDSLIIRAESNNGANKLFKLKFDKEAYVFLDYVHDSLMTVKEKEANEKMKKELNGYDPSVLLAKKAIMEKVLYEKPILY